MCFPDWKGLRIAIVFHFIWVLGMLGYTIFLLIAFGPHLISDALLTWHLIILFLIQLPQIENLAF